MIYTYKYLSHPIEKFHNEIAYFFEQLFKHAPQKYNDKLLLRPNFIAVVDASSGRLKNNLISITESYYLLSTKDKSNLKKAFKNNCKIVETCRDNRLIMTKYTSVSNKKFLKTLKDFLTMLWEEYPQNQLLENKYGTIQSHFVAFLDPNHQRALVCPFCGLYPLKPYKGIYRNAYDHFIPKAMYPFVSINFLNLFPICHECNSDEKKETDTLYINSKRRKALHPLDTSYNPDELSISIKLNETYSTQSLKTLLQNIDWEYAITLAGKTDPRLITWDEVFNIKRRYKEYILTYEKTWFEDILLKRYREDITDGLSFDRFKEKLMTECKDQIQYPLGILKYVYFNFLFSISGFEAKLNAI